MRTRTNTPPITSFRGDYAFLSNFHESPLHIGSVVYPTVEHAYQCLKVNQHLPGSVLERDRILHRRDALGAAGYTSPGSAKARGAVCPLRSGWEEAKLALMCALLRRKFSEHRDLRALLEATGDAILVEGNEHGDTYWGVCRGSGSNHLGHLLMLVRSRNWIEDHWGGRCLEEL
jgi:hypothetical protein